MLFNPGLMEQPPFLPLPPGLSGALYTLVYLEPPQYSHVYLEPPLSHGLPGATLFPGQPGAPLPPDLHASPTSTP